MLDKKTINWLEIVFPNDSNNEIEVIDTYQFGKALIKARKLADYNREQATGAIGISTRFLERYEDGLMYPKVEVLLKLLHIYMLFLLMR